MDPKKKERFAELVGLGAAQPEAAQGIGVHVPGHRFDQRR